MSATLTVGQAAVLVLAMFAVLLLARALWLWWRRGNPRHAHAWSRWRLISGPPSYAARSCSSCGRTQRRGIG